MEVIGRGKQKGIQLEISTTMRFPKHVNVGLEDDQTSKIMEIIAESSFTGILEMERYL